VVLMTLLAGRRVPRLGQLRGKESEKFIVMPCDLNTTYYTLKARV